MNETGRSSRVAVVVPVYCEKDTAPPLVRELFAQRVDADLEVWVVDDNSPDGTAAAVDRLRPEFPRLNVLSRPAPQGRGAAVLDAFARLLARDDPPDLFVEMDGDGSHEAANLVTLLDAVVDADVVIGSRYAAGGGADLTPRRRLLSKLANGFAGWVLGLPYDDCSTGYRCYRREALAGLDLASLSCGGHATHLEMLFELHRAGARITEVPIHYRARRGGVSKVTLRETLRVARVLLAMRLAATGRAGRTW
jgi:glycosyltransferase involved in cell wall biosynthesis